MGWEPWASVPSAANRELQDLGARIAGRGALENVAPKPLHWLGGLPTASQSALPRDGTSGFSTISPKQRAAGPWSEELRPRSPVECRPEAVSLARRAPPPQVQSAGPGDEDLGPPYHQPQAQICRTLKELKLQCSGECCLETITLTERAPPLRVGSAVPGGRGHWASVLSAASTELLERRAQAAALRRMGSGCEALEPLTSATTGTWSPSGKGLERPEWNPLPQALQAGH